MLLQNELARLETYIKEAHQLKTTVSSRAIAWHLDHSLKVLIRVSEALQKSDPAAYVWKFNSVRTIIFLLGYIPRGKGKAPKQVLPPANIHEDDLYSQIVVAKKGLQRIESLPASCNFKHPYFGVLNVKQTQKFLKLHTRHHLKICADIIN